MEVNGTCLLCGVLKVDGCCGTRPYLLHFIDALSLAGSTSKTLLSHLLGPKSINVSQECMLVGTKNLHRKFIMQFSEVMAKVVQKFQKIWIN